MRIRIFTLRYSSSLGGFDDEPLQVFMRDKEVTGFKEHFFVNEDAPHLCCVVTYHDCVVGKHPAGFHAARSQAPASTSPSSRSPSRNNRPDPTAGLDAEERALFQILREWRTETAHQDGVPPYVVLTNKEQVEIVRKRPESLTALAAIEGIGRQKVKRYGRRLLAVLHGTLPEPPERDGDGTFKTQEPQDPEEQQDPQDSPAEGAYGGHESDRGRQKTPTSDTQPVNSL